MTYEPNTTQSRENSFGRTGEGPGATDQVKQQAQEKLDASRARAASGLDSIVDAAAVAAAELRNHNQEGLSQYVGEIADSVSSIANSIRHKSVDELLHDVEAVARKNPTLFLAGSLAVGLGIGRFARASSKERFVRDDYRESGRNYADDDFSRSQSAEAYSERADGFESVDGVQQVTEEDYLADDYAFAAGEDIDLKNDDFAQRDSDITSRQKDNQLNPGNQFTSGNNQFTSGNNQFTSGNGNQPIGGDFYE